LAQQSTGQWHVNRFTEDEQDELQTLFIITGVSACLAYFENKMPQWKTVPLNVGIIGASGVEKSSFINALMGVKSKTKGAAKVGMTEETLTPTAYYHPNNDMLTF